jgi:hypothetical protein
LGVVALARPDGTGRRLTRLLIFDGPIVRGVADRWIGARLVYRARDGIQPFQIIGFTQYLAEAEGNYESNCKPTHDEQAYLFNVHAPSPILTSLEVLLSSPKTPFGATISDGGIR